MWFCITLLFTNCSTKRGGNDPKDITDERLKEIAAIIPAPDDESPEITETEIARARFAHEFHPEWFTNYYEPEGSV